MYKTIGCATSILKIFATQKEAIDIFFIKEQLVCISKAMLFYKLLWISEVIGERKNYEDFNCSFGKVLNVVGEQFTPL